MTKDTKIHNKISAIKSSIDKFAESPKPKISVDASQDPLYKLFEQKFGPKLAKGLVPIVNILAKYPKASKMLQELFQKQRHRTPRR